jgi:type II secretory pathway component PulF
MAKAFQYVAIDASGKKHTGELELGARSEVIRHLQGQGMRPASIKEVASSGRKKQELKAVSDGPLLLKQKDVIAFTEELSELLEAGLPLEPALASMEDRDESGLLKEASARLRRQVTEGEQMYQALPRVSPAFDQLYCNLVKAGEASGSLQKILKQHSEYLKEQSELKSRLILAMVYPGILLLGCFSASLLFIFFLFPKITVLLASMPDTEMPLGVRLSNGLNEALRNHWVLIIVAIVIAMIGVKLWFQSEKNKEIWDEVKLKLPAVGKVFSYGLYVQWLQTLENLLESGVPLVQALDLTAETIPNRYYRKKLDQISNQVGDGYRLTRSMRKSEMFPPNMVDLIGVGENTGKLSRALGRAEAYYDKQLGTVIKGVLALVSPVVLVIMAVMVLVMCMTIFQTIGETLKGLGG